MKLLQELLKISEAPKSFKVTFINERDFDSTNSEGTRGYSNLDVFSISADDIQSLFGEKASEIFGVLEDPKNADGKVVSELEDAIRHDKLKSTKSQQKFTFELSDDMPSVISPKTVIALYPEL